MRSYDLRKIDILVLEKHQLIRSLLKQVFHEFGVMDVQLHSCPSTAFQAFVEKPVDLVIADWTPDLDGIGFLRRIRNHQQTPNPFVPVIMLTAYTELNRVCTARDAGMHEFLAKPVSAGTLYSRLCAVIERNRPFIRSLDFFGPDRRRSKAQHRGPERRYKTANEAADLTDAQVEALLAP